LDRISTADQEFIQSGLLKQLDRQTIGVEMTSMQEVDKRWGYRPVGLELTDVKPDALRSLPELKSKTPLFGEITLGDRGQKVLLILDAMEEGLPRLFIDRNGDKDLSNDGDGKVESSQPGFISASNVVIDVAYSTGNAPYSLNFSQWTKRTPRSISYRRNTTRTGVLRLGIKSYPISITEGASTGVFSDLEKDTLAVDRSGNGISTVVDREEFILGEVACELSEVSPDGKKLKINLSSLANERRLTVKLSALNGLMDSVSFYSPQSLTLTNEPPFPLKAEPEYRSKNPRYASLVLGDGPSGQVCVAFDEPVGDYWRIFVDLNGDGDLTNDGDGAWSSVDGETLKLSNVQINVAYSTGRSSYALQLYRLPDRQPDQIVYHRDCAREGSIRIDGTDCRILVLDNNSDGRFDDLENSQLFIDARNSSEQNSLPTIGMEQVKQLG